MDNFRRFVIIFTVFVFVTIVVTGFFLALHYNRVLAGQTESIEVEKKPIEIKPQVKEDDSVVKNILLTVGNIEDEELLLIAVLNINTVKNTMSFLFIPNDLQYSVDNENEEGQILKVGSICHREGIEKCSEVLSSILDIAISNYIHFDEEAFVKFFNIFSSIESGIDFELPVSFSYTYEGRTVSFNKGKMKLSGIDVLNLLRFYRTDDNTYKSELLKYYNGRQTCRLKMFKSFIYEFILSKFILQENDYYSKNFNQLFTKNLMEDLVTNINQNNIPIVQNYLSSLTKKDLAFYIINGDEHFNDTYLIKYNGALLDLSVEEKFGLCEATAVFEESFECN